jgi:hypothetical protein
MVKLSSLGSDELILYLTKNYIKHFQADEMEGSQIGRAFEEGLYNVIQKYPNFTLISTSGDLRLGHELSTTSGIRHETDCVVSDGATLYVFELKHYFEGSITKEMLVVFNQKVLDFYLELLRLGRTCKIKRIFVTKSSRLVNFAREFAMSWGIGLVDNELLPPLLLHRLMFDWTEKHNFVIAHEWWNIANELATFALRGLDEFFVPFSTKQVSIDVNAFLGPHECQRLVANHERLHRYLEELYINSLRGRQIAFDSADSRS